MELLRHCSRQETDACRARNGQWPESAFDKRGNGLHVYCKLCRRSMARAYKKRHRKAMTIYLRKWKELHPGRIPELRRARYLRKLDEEKGASRQWARKNPILRRAYQRLRYVEAGGHWMTDAEWLEVLMAYGNRCLRCGSPKITVDHVIPISEGGIDTKENTQPLCLSCNSSKKCQHTDYRPDKGIRWFAGT